METDPAKMYEVGKQNNQDDKVYAEQQQRESHQCSEMEELSLPKRTRLELTEEDDDEYFDGESDGGERDSIRKRAREARREKRNIISSERHSSNYSSHELSKAAHESSQNPVRGAARSSSPQEHTLHPHQIIDEHGQPSDEGLLPNPPRSHAHESYEDGDFEERKRLSEAQVNFLKGAPPGRARENTNHWCIEKTANVEMQFINGTTLAIRGRKINVQNAVFYLDVFFSQRNGNNIKHCQTQHQHYSNSFKMNNPENFNNLNETSTNAMVVFADFILAEAIVSFYKWLQTSQVHLQQAKLEQRNDFTIVPIPAKAAGFVSGGKGSNLRKLEEEFHVLLFYLRDTDFSSSNDDSDKRKESPSMLILGAAQARCATELRVLTLIETKVEGYITNDIVSNLEQRYKLQFTDGVSLEKETVDEVNISYMLGRHGSTKQMIESASGCTMEYLNNMIVCVGALRACERAKTYLEWLIIQRDSGRPVNATGRADVTIANIPISRRLSCIRDIPSLRDVQRKTGTFCFADGGPTRPGHMRILVCGEDAVQRLTAKAMIEDLIGLPISYPMTPHFRKNAPAKSTSHDFFRRSRSPRHMSPPVSHLYSRDRPRERSPVGPPPVRHRPSLLSHERYNRTEAYARCSQPPRMSRHSASQHDLHYPERYPHYDRHLLDTYDHLPPDPLLRERERDRGGNRGRVLARDHGRGRDRARDHGRDRKRDLGRARLPLPASPPPTQTRDQPRRNLPTRRSKSPLPRHSIHSRFRP
eukprot:gene4124-59_t